jgi:hypothetical protein
MPRRRAGVWYSHADFCSVRAGFCSGGAHFWHIEANSSIFKVTVTSSVLLAGATGQDLPPIVLGAAPF